jgi:phage terminase large subunit GpA-like protein
LPEALAVATLDRLAATVLGRLQPPPRLAVSKWLDEHRVIPREYPSPFPGPWRTSRTPYLREPLDAFTDPSIEALVLYFSSQIGKTEALFGMLLYSYGVNAGPGMLVLPTLDLADSISTDRLAPALASCDAVQVGQPGSRSSEDAKRAKKINGLPLTLAGSNSAASLASRPVRDLFCDEIDKWKDETEAGDPLALARQRTASFRRRKIVLCSTPTVKGASRIEDEFEVSDKRLLFSPCPRCGQFWVVRWANVRWERDRPETAYIEHVVWEETAKGPKQAGGCGGRIEENERMRMVTASEWRPTAPFRGVRGYRVWAWVSPWLRLSEIVSQFLTKKDRPATLCQFVNEILAEPFEPASEKVESSSLLVRREEYKEQVPAGALVLTMGVDTQDDRLEVLVMGWGEGEEAWVIHRESLWGDPDEPEVWAQLDGVLTRDWPREAGGVTRIQCSLIDALGHRTQSVYGACVARRHLRLYPSIGRDGGDSSGQLVSSPKLLQTKAGNLNRFVVDASQAKALIYSRLKVEARKGHAVIHFPMTVTEAFFEELTSEHLVTERNKYGVPTKKWALRPGRTRNETLDCCGMSLAALRVICPTPSHFTALARSVVAVSVRPTTAAAPAGRSAPAGSPPPAPPQRAPRTKNWGGR